MSAPRAIALAPSPPPAIRAPRSVTVCAAIAGMAAIGAAAFADAPRVWSNVLVDGFFLVSLALGGLVFVAIHHLSGAAWSAGMRRVAEALTGVLPFAALMMIALVFGRASLYPWAGAGESAGHVAGSWFFRPAIVFTRMAVFLALWSACASALRRASDAQDASASPVYRQRAIRRAAVFVVMFALSLPLAAIDWLLSLNPEWTSTIFFVYVFAGILVEGVAAITLATLLLRERGLLRDVVNENHLHDLGKLLLAFTTFWAYIWLCQYLLIWYGNIPEEAGYYQTRTGSDWLPWFAANVVINWVVPFVVLLPRAAKRSAATLKIVAVILLLGRWIDVYLLVAPEAMHGAKWGVLEIAMAAACAGVAWHLVADALERRPLVVRHDPSLEACLHHHQ